MVIIFFQNRIHIIVVPASSNREYFSAATFPQHTHSFQYAYGGGVLRCYTRFNTMKLELVKSKRQNCFQCFGSITITPMTGVEDYITSASVMALRDKRLVWINDDS
jgi:hypothetical protein